MNRFYCFVPSVFLLICLSLTLGGCSKTYYNAMEKVGIHKRDILVSRVEKARDSQTEAQTHFKSALDAFQAVVNLEKTDLKTAYTTVQAEYEASEDAAEKVTARIEKVDAVAEALFVEWEKELALYENQKLRQLSATQLQATKTQYQKMLTGMRQAEASMGPVLKIYGDNLLFMKHNLNAQAIGALKGEFAALQQQIDQLLKKMNVSIAASDAFIADLKK